MRYDPGDRTAQRIQGRFFKEAWCETRLYVLLRERLHPGTAAAPDSQCSNAGRRDNLQELNRYLSSSGHSHRPCRSSNKKLRAQVLLGHRKRDNSLFEPGKRGQNAHRGHDRGEFYDI